MKWLTIPSRLTQSYSFPFPTTDKLLHVTIVGSGSVGDVFSRCKSLEVVTIKEGVTGIGESAFAGCTNLSHAKIPDSVTSIGDYAFYNCYSLYFVSKPRGVTSVGEEAFRYAGCEDTMKIYLHLPDPKDSRK